MCDCRYIPGTRVLLYISQDHTFDFTVMLPGRQIIWEKITIFFQDKEIKMNNWKFFLSNWLICWNLSELSVKYTCSINLSDSPKMLSVLY